MAIIHAGTREPPKVLGPKDAKKIADAIWKISHETTHGPVVARPLPMLEAEYEARGANGERAVVKKEQIISALIHVLDKKLADELGDEGK